VSPPSSKGRAEREQKKKKDNKTEENKMKKMLLSLSISVLLLLSLLAFSSPQLLTAKAANSSTNSGTPAPTVGQVPLTNAEIKADWPNLPTAQELWNSNVSCEYIDLNFNGKVQSSDTGMPAPEAPTVMNLLSTIVNCTVTTPNYYSGGFSTCPQIWEQYNSTIWVLVPLQYLPTSNSNTSPTPQSATTWAIGAYQNPATLTSSAVTGACSFGEFTQSTFGSGSDYLGVCVVTVETANLVYQMVMQLNASGQFLINQVINPTTGQLVQAPQTESISGAALNTLYSTYIEYVTGIGWVFGFNSVGVWSYKGDSSTQILTGNQPTAVVETNDFSQNDFASWSTQIGGTYTATNGTQYPLPDACYLFNGNWYPYQAGQNDPQTWAYLGGNQLGTWGSVGGQGPPTNWTTVKTVGENHPQVGELSIGPGKTVQSNGNVLWNESPLP
jgi:hypothetical protein